MQKKENRKTIAALAFLCARNPLDLSQSDYVFLIMDFQDHKGDRAIEALAGFYCYAIDNYHGEERSFAIRSTFSHDLGGAKDRYLEPRSIDYAEFWDKEIENRPQLLNF